jgi:hypothetical protein
MVQAIPGAMLIEDITDAYTATHVIATDGTSDIRRTSKLMIAMCRTPNIITLDWLIQSAEAQKPLECTRFRILNKKNYYRTMEQQYNFSMRTALNNVLRRWPVHGDSTGTTALVFDGWSIYVSVNVAGHKAPPMNEFRIIIEASGAIWLSSITKTTGRKQQNDDGTDRKSLIITSDPPTKQQLSQNIHVQQALQRGAIHRTTTWFFHTIMMQEIDTLTI